LKNPKNCTYCHLVLDHNLIERYSESYGRIFAYDKTYDRVTTKTERALQSVDHIKYNPTTSDDPVIQQVGFEKITTNGF
jgi:hypothetical protein